MKKYIGICLAVITIGFLTGCGSKTKTLTCTKEEPATGMSINHTIKVDFKKNDVTQFKILETITVEDAYVTYIEQLKEAFESQFVGYQEKKGITMNTELKDHNIEISIIANLKEMDDDAKASLDIVDTKANYDDMKKTLENQSYNCK